MQNVLSTWLLKNFKVDIKNYLLTLIGLVLSIAFFLVSLIFGLDTFEALTGVLTGLEEYEADELFLSIVILCVFASLDALRRRRRRKIETEKLKIYKAMLSSTRHILNNFLNQMLLFKLTADKSPDFDPNVLKLYDQIIENAMEEIKALGEISEINESAIEASVTPKSAPHNDES